jgi:predicted enzyme related to lactoylglutathione lyase
MKLGIIEQASYNCNVIELLGFCKQFYRGESIMTNQDKVQVKQQASTLNLNSIMIGTAQPTVLAAFYEKVFGRPADMTEGGWHMWQAGNCSISVGEHSEVKGQAKEPSRIMLNLETKQVKEEFARLKGTATVIKEPYELGGGWIATLADPDGNFIQLMTPWEM